MPAGTEGTQRLGLTGKRGDEEVKETKSLSGFPKRKQGTLAVRSQTPGRPRASGGNPWEELGGRFWRSPGIAPGGREVAGAAEPQTRALTAEEGRAGRGGEGKTA